MRKSKVAKPLKVLITGKKTKSKQVIHLSDEDPIYASIDARFTEMEARFTKIDATLEKMMELIHHQSARFEELAANDKFMLDHLNMLYLKHKKNSKEKPVKI